MKVLLLGGGGFIGFNLLKKIHNDKDCSITVFDLTVDKVECFENDITLIKDDIRTYPLLEDLVKSNDVIVDLIAHANPSLYVKRPIDVFNINFLENLKILEFCVKHNKRLIQFSTCEVYGTTVRPWLNVEDASQFETLPFNEDTTPMIMGPVNKHRWIYAVGKSLLERVLHAYGLEDKLDYTIIRPFNFIGPKIDYLPDVNLDVFNNDNPRVFSNFLNNILYNKPLMLVNGGLQERTYTYIDDAIDAINKVIFDKSGISKHKIYNIGNPKNETTIKNFAEVMLSVYKENWWDGKTSIPGTEDIAGENFYGKGYDDCDKRIPCIDSITSDFDWECKHDFRETIYLTMKDFMDELNLTNE